MTSAQERKIKQTGCDARFDNLTRQLYATDASIYQIEPIGVAFPKSAQQASLVIRAAADAGLGGGARPNANVSAARRFPAATRCLTRDAA